MYSLKKITDILVNYWFTFLIFAIIACFAVDYRYTVSGILLEAFALSRPTMCFCWYVYFYICVMLIILFFVKIIGRNIHVDLAIIISVFQVVMVLINKFLSILDANGIIYDICSSLGYWFPDVAIGYVFARYRLFEKVWICFQRIKKAWLQVLLVVIALLGSCMGRYFLPAIYITIPTIPIINKGVSFSCNLDYLYAPLFIFSIIGIARTIRIKQIGFVIRKIGKHSLSMWFVHCIFFNNSKSVTQKILYFPKNPILVFIWGVLLCLGISIAFDFITDKIKEKNKLFKGI